MKIKIYQIDTKRDKARVRFESLDALERDTGSREIDSRIYNRVYAGEVDCASLEDVYWKFNQKPPADFYGHSLSVSDVVEIVKEDASTFHYCDSIGFAEVAFQPEQAGARLRVLLLEPGKVARLTEIDGTLAGMQRVVGGPIEVMYPYREEVALVMNEEGKLDGLPLNRAVRSEEPTHEVLDIIAGTCFLCGCGGEDFSSLSAEQGRKYYQQFRYPESFIRTAKGIAVIPYKPKDKEPVR
ncbi:MAG: DUF3846 domain-containing protein [Oscillospiraceae bacterium]|nr:DUF3846 domain-containing protein [Oscillospiraceae bacterium]